MRAALRPWRRGARSASERVRSKASVETLDTTFDVPAWQSNATLRTLLLHMIHEYARHNGHADLLRETVDGVTGA